MKHPGLANYWMMILLLAMVCLAYSPVETVFSQTTAVVVEPEAVTANLGEPFTITVRLSNVQNLYGIEVILNWNPDILEVTNVDVRLGVETYSDGVLHETDSSPPVFIAENNITQTLGQYRLVATSMNPAPSFNGSGNIVRITFNPLSLGDSILDLESQLSDYPPLDRDPRISFLIDHTTMDSTVTIYESTSTPTPTSPPASPTPSPTGTPTPTLTPTPTSTPEPPISNLKIEYILAILAIIVVPILIYLYLKRRKQSD